MKSISWLSKPFAAPRISSEVRFALINWQKWTNDFSSGANKNVALGDDTDLFLLEALDLVTRDFVVGAVFDLATDGVLEANTATSASESLVSTIASLVANPALPAAVRADGRTVAERVATGRVATGRVATGRGDLIELTIRIYLTLKCISARSKSFKSFIRVVYIVLRPASQYAKNEFYGITGHPKKNLIFLNKNPSSAVRPTSETVR
jgi:hypothetical protein